MIGALYILSVLAVASAWGLARRDRTHRPVAVLLTLGLASDVAVRALQAFYLESARVRLGVSVPWTGTDRIVGHVSDAVVLLWPAALAGASIAVFLGWRPWLAVAGYVLAVVAFIVLHPIGGNGSLPLALKAFNVASVAVAVGCAATWYMKTEKSGERPNTARAALLVLLPIELASLAGAWRLGFAKWHLSQIAYLVMFSILVLIQGGSLWGSPPSSSSPPSS